MKQYKDLLEVYAAILRGELDPSQCFLMADAGDLKIWYIDSEENEGKPLLRTYEDTAFDFVARILGMERELP